MSDKSFIKKIDVKIFQQIEQLSSSSFYQGFQESLSSLDDNIKEIIKYLISIFILLIPIIITLIFWFNNYNLKKDLEARKDLYNEANYMIQDQKSFGEQGKRLIPSGAPTSKTALSTKISNLLKRTQVPTDQIRIKNFKSSAMNDKVQKNTADIVFNNFTTAHLSKLSSELSLRLRIKIIGIEALRNSGKNLIEGKISITYLSPAS